MKLFLTCIEVKLDLPKPEWLHTFGKRSSHTNSKAIFQFKEPSHFFYLGHINCVIVLLSHGGSS